MILHVDRKIRGRLINQNETNIVLYKEPTIIKGLVIV